MLHGTHILLMVTDAGGRTIQARLAPVSRAKNTSALRNLTDSLAVFCHATADEQRAKKKDRSRSVALTENRIEGPGSSTRTARQDVRLLSEVKNF